LGAFRLCAFVFAGSHTHSTRPGKLRRTAGGLHFGGGELRAEIRRSCLRSLKSVPDLLQVPAAQPRTRHFHAEHVAGKARSGASRGVRLQLSRFSLVFGDPVLRRPPRWPACAQRLLDAAPRQPHLVTGELQVAGTEAEVVEKPNRASGSQQGAPKKKKNRRTYLPTFFEIFCDFQV
jgi:hypothetical protein